MEDYIRGYLKGVIQRDTRGLDYSSCALCTRCVGNCKSSLGYSCSDIG